jgi:hypothetical protein
VNKLDFIGDIHGHYQKFVSLLAKLGYLYSDTLNTYVHPEGRKIVVLGDFINVGMQNKEVLQCLYQMHRQGQAHIIAGNHEYFLLLLHHKTLLNKNTLWYYLQRNYYPLYDEFKNNREQLYFYIDWISKLPIYIDFGSVKAIHALWDEDVVNSIKNYNSVGQLINMVCENSQFKENVNKLIMGMTYKHFSNEYKRPLYFRYMWWNAQHHLSASQMFMNKWTVFSDEISSVIDMSAYTIKETPCIVFFGHYSLQGFPYITSPTKCCLDFGGAKGGYLTAYRWDGLSELSEHNLINV